MKLIVLGSGASVPHARRSSAAHWLETSSGTVLVDVSADAPRRMAQEGLDWASLDAIWVSHFHLDHLGGLAPFLFATRSAPETQQRRKPLKIYGGPGLKEILQAIDGSNNYRLFQQPFVVEIVEVGTESDFEMLPLLRARTFSTPHTKESLAVHLTDKNDTIFVYTSDTGYSDELAEFAHGADVLLAECSYFRNKPVQKHLELKEAIDLARKAEPKTLVLSHLYDEWDGIDLAAEAGKLWSGKTVEAYDGLQIEF